MFAQKTKTLVLFLLGLIPCIAQNASAQYSHYVIDSSFNQTGQLFTNIGGQVVRSLVLPDTTILLGGNGNVNGNARVILLRLNNDGSPYNQWGFGGKVVDSFLNSDQDQLRDMIYLPTERILTLVMTDSVTTSPPHTYFKYALSKHLMNGNLDSTFGLNGMVKLIASNNLGAKAISYQSDGKIIIAGSYNGDIMVCRLNTNGVIDSSFYLDGISSVGIGTLPMDGASAVQVLPDDRIVVAGGTYHSAQQWATVCRFFKNGSLDWGFNFTGYVETNVSSYGDFLDNIVIQPNGKILATGYNAHTNGPITILAIRYDSTGALDPTFGSGGVKVKNINNYDDKSYNAVVQPDGKIVLGGYNTNASINVDFMLYRMDSSGNDDPSFALNGLIRGNFYFNQSNFNDHGQTMCAQADGKLIVAGYSSLSGGGNMAAMRWKPTVITPPNGINAISKEETISIYPNPARETLNIAFGESPSIKTVVLYNLIGKVVGTYPVSGNNMNIDLSEMSSGLYFLRFINACGEVTAIRKFTRL